MELTGGLLCNHHKKVYHGTTIASTVGAGVGAESRLQEIHKEPRKGEMVEKVHEEVAHINDGPRMRVMVPTHEVNDQLCVAILCLDAQSI